MRLISGLFLFLTASAACTRTSELEVSVENSGESIEVLMGGELESLVVDVEALVWEPESVFVRPDVLDAEVAEARERIREHDTNPDGSNAREWIESQRVTGRDALVLWLGAVEWHLERKEQRFTASTIGLALKVGPRSTLRWLERRGHSTAEWIDRAFYARHDTPSVREIFCGNAVPIWIEQNNRIAAHALRFMDDISISEQAFPWLFGGEGGVMKSDRWYGEDVWLSRIWVASFARRGELTECGQILVSEDEYPVTAGICRVFVRASMMIEQGLSDEYETLLEASGPDARYQFERLREELAR